VKCSYEFNHGSGSNVDDAHCIGYRYDARWEWTPESGESWVIELRDHKLHCVLVQPGWLTDLWHSPTGGVFSSFVNGRVVRNLEPTSPPDAWTTDTLSGTLAGIWGLADDLVFTWGQRDGKPYMLRWDGKVWAEIGVPGFVVAVHGIRPDLIYAVGREGLLARWDGNAWSALASPLASTLSAVFVSSDDETYACASSGQLLAGSTHGWAPIASHARMLHAVARFAGSIWVGGGPDGLLRLDGGQLVPLKPNIKAKRLDARAGGLLITAPDAVVETRDGQRFWGQKIDGFSGIVADQSPSWVGTPREGPGTS